ncbi:uncharacterized protein LOC144287586 [Canis aureus]
MFKEQNGSSGTLERKGKSMCDLRPVTFSCFDSGMKELVQGGGPATEEGSRAQGCRCSQEVMSRVEGEVEGAVRPGPQKSCGSGGRTSAGQLCRRPGPPPKHHGVCEPRGLA